MLRLSLFFVRCGVSESLIGWIVERSLRGTLCLPVGSVWLGCADLMM